MTKQEMLNTHYWMFHSTHAGTSGLNKVVKICKVCRSVWVDFKGGFIYNGKDCEPNTCEGQILIDALE